MSEQKTIKDQMDEIAEEICSHYCHWPYVWDEEKEGKELIDSEHCQNCPLNKL